MFKENDIVKCISNSDSIYIKDNLYLVIRYQGVIRLKPLVGNKWPGGQRVRRGNSFNPRNFVKI